VPYSHRQVKQIGQDFIPDEFRYYVNNEDLTPYLPPFKDAPFLDLPTMETQGLKKLKNSLSHFAILQYLI
jgi:hypothetical protein